MPLLENQIGFIANVVRLYRGEEPDFTLGSTETEVKLKEVFGAKPKYSDVAGGLTVGSIIV